MEEGYLQSKIREQAEKISNLENEIKKQGITIEGIKREYYNANQLMIKATDIEGFKKHIKNIIGEDVSMTLSKQYKFIEEHAKRDLNKFVDVSIKMIDESLSEMRKAVEKEKENSYSVLFGLFKVLIEKDVINSDDVNKMSIERELFERTGFSSMEKEMEEKMSQYMKRQNRKAERILTRDALKHL